MMRNQKSNAEHGGIITSLVALIFLVVLCSLIYFARHPIMRFAAESWVIDEPAAHADVIVVIGDDNYYADRATHGAELYRKGIASEIVASGRRVRPNASIADLMEHDLVERGVPKEKIFVFTHDAEDTKEEAEALSRLADQHGWKSLVIVTSNYHARRTRYIFQKVLPAGISVSVAGARDGDFDPERWWEKRISVKLFTRELAGMAESVWELRNYSRPLPTSSNPSSVLYPSSYDGKVMHITV
jgi:uncharacterized SAM-binding protein YcdF (DUF218 family)